MKCGNNVVLLPIITRIMTYKIKISAKQGDLF